MPEKKKISFELDGSTEQLQLMSVLAQVLDWGFNNYSSLQHRDMSAVINWFSNTYREKYWNREENNRLVPGGRIRRTAGEPPATLSEEYGG